MRSTLARLALIFGVAWSACFAASTPGGAGILYDNLSVASAGADPANPTIFGPLYDSFSTGSSGFSLTEIGLSLQATNPLDFGTFTITLLSAATAFANPAAIVFSSTFSDSQLLASLSTFDVNFSQISLAADTRYWVEVSSNGSVQWSFASDASGTGVAGEFSENLGGVTLNGPPTPDGETGFPYQMLISDQQIPAVPELSSWMMMILGLMGLGIVNQLRSSKGSAVRNRLFSIETR
jgi:hypothetical protein